MSTSNLIFSNSSSLARSTAALNSVSSYPAAPSASCQMHFSSRFGVSFVAQSSPQPLSAISCPISHLSSMRSSHVAGSSAARDRHWREEYRSRRQQRFPPISAIAFTKTTPPKWCICVAVQISVSVFGFISEVGVA